MNRPNGTIDSIYNLACRPGTPAEGEAARAKFFLLCKKHNIDPFIFYDMSKIMEAKRKMQTSAKRRFNKIHIDFETFSASPLQDVGAWTYANHPSTDLICLAWAFNDDEPSIWTAHDNNVRGFSTLEELFEKIKEGWEVFAWNAQFEYYIWKYCATKKYGWPDIPLEQFQDAQALALSLALPLQLGKCGDALNLDIQKDKSGKRLINKLSKPRRPTKLNPAIRWTYENASIDYEDMYEYCLQDVRSERAICDVLPIHHLPGYERDLWLMTVRLNDNGVPVDIDTVKYIRHLLQQYEKVQVSRLSKITDGDVTTVGQIARMKKWMAEYYDIHFDSLNTEAINNALEKGGLPKPVEQLLNIRRLMSRTSTKKYNRIVDMVDSNGFVHDILRYHMATTGRWGGSGLQVHNLPNAKVDDPDLVAKVVKWKSLRLFIIFYDDPMYVGSAMIRPIVRAKLGFKLYVSDFNSIENRVTCWLADDQESLNLFRARLDQYVWFATKLYEIEYDNVNKHQRTHAKTCILGLGYGMGIDKFHETCVSYGMDVTYDEAKRSVNLYREIFHKIVDLWYKSYACAMETILTGTTTRYIHLRFIKENNFLFMELPSGRRIAYYDPKVEPVSTPWGETKRGITFMGHQPYTRKWGRLKLIPGRLIENAAQGMARDIMAEAKLRVIERGYNVIFSVHDEIVSHDPVNFGSLKEFNEILCDTNVKTYPGLPIDAEGFVANRYRKG